MTVLIEFIDPFRVSLGLPELCLTFHPKDYEVAKGALAPHRVIEEHSTESYGGGTK